MYKTVKVALDPTPRQRDTGTVSRLRPRRRGLLPKEQVMLNRNEGPRGGFMVWLMAVIVVSLAAKVDTTTVDVVVLAIGAYAMLIHSRQ